MCKSFLPRYASIVLEKNLLKFIFFSLVKLCPIVAGELITVTCSTFLLYFILDSLSPKDPTAKWNWSQQTLPTVFEDKNREKTTI